MIEKKVKVSPSKRAFKLIQDQDDLAVVNKFNSQASSHGKKTEKVYCI